jgi:hypothetical protein
MQSAKFKLMADRNKTLSKLRSFVFVGAILISVIGAATTLQEITAPSKNRTVRLFTVETCQTLFAISWVLFVVTIWLAAGSAVFLVAHHGESDEDKESGDLIELAIIGSKLSSRKFNRISNILCIATALALVLAWVFCCIGLTGYSPVPGVIGLFILGAVLLSLFTLLILM